MELTAPPRPSAQHLLAEPPRTGAFADVRTRWLPLWAALGLLLVVGLGALTEDYLGMALPDDLEGILSYVWILAWVLVVVVVRGGVDLTAMLRWPRLGTYWFVVAGLLVVQFLFSLAAILVTELVAPWLSESVAGLGEGNLVLALIGIVVLPPLVEEIVFRGVLVERFTVKWRVSVAVLLSAAFFGVLHADPVGAAMFGVITGLLYLRTGSLWPGIVIHAANNLVAVIAVRTADPTADPLPPPEVGETLMVAAVLLVMSVPFLAWFILRTWPASTTPTTYQRHELTHGLPNRSLAGVRWSGWHGSLTLEVSDTTAALRDSSGSAVAVLALPRIRGVYLSPVPGGQQVVVLLHDGSWTTMQIPPGDRRPTQRLARILGERAALASVGSTPAPTEAAGRLGANPAGPP